MAAHTKIDLYQMQSLPLDAKIRMTARRIDAFIDRNDAYLSISGGKDSRVLDDIERRFVRAKLPRVFIDTGLEHRSVRACGKKHADIILRPEKNFKQIITEYGYPVISKEVAQTIAEARKGLKNGNCYTYRMAKLNGTAVDKNGDKSKYNIPQYKFLLDAPFRISHKCCDYMKKKPAKQYEKETGRLPIVATMAEESNLRLQKWYRLQENWLHILPLRNTAKKKAGQGNELQILQPFTPVITGDISKAAGKRDFTYRKF